LLAAALVVLGVACTAWAFERRRRRTHAVRGGLHPEITLPHEAEFELYHNALSLCSKKTRVCLAELGIDYRSHPIDLIETGAYENIRAPFLAVNPAGIVPVLVHRGHPIYESHDQIRHAADHAPAGAPRLVPDDSALAAEMQAWVDRASLTGDNPLEDTARSAGNAVPGLTTPLFAAMVATIPTWRIAEGLLFHRLKLRPVVFLALKAFGIRRLHRLPPAMQALRVCARAMKVHLDALEEQLAKSGGPWILGDAFTLADVSWVVILERLVEADVLPLFLAERPGVAAYWDRLRARPSHASAISDHGHPTITAGIAALKDAKRANPALRSALEDPCR
jgi:glutathione S-transferase